MTGIFPFPDDRHAGRELGLVVVCAPLLLVAALRGRQEARLLHLYSIGTTILLVVMTALMMGVGGVVTPRMTAWRSGLVEGREAYTHPVFRTD
jgi:hypothetical protein